ncbi:collagenase [Actinomadura sp. 9N215]|uniref:collagenase n=1 Tax=Actinomadura sp. 9N215 TaxID=3375150 RepID=UPI0037999976
MVLALAVGLLVSPASAHPKPHPVTARTGGVDGHVRKSVLPVVERPPLSPSPHEFGERLSEKGEARAAGLCEPGDFGGRSGSVLVRQIKASSKGCIDTLFGLAGKDAYAAFRESQMFAVALALRHNAVHYPGDNRTGTAQLVLYLRAGYYVQWYNPSAVASYGVTLKKTVQAGLDAYFGNSKSSTVSDANGEVLAEAVTLVDSAQENGRYIYVVKRLLNGYNATYDKHWRMLNAVNNVYLILFRGHQVPEFVSAVEGDPSVLDALNSFAVRQLGLLGTARGYLTSNAGRELGRFLQHTSLREKVRPLVKRLLGASHMTGRTAALWVGVADMTRHYDQANCTYYDTCDLRKRLERSVLTVDRSCSSSIRIRAQDMTAAQLSETCASLVKQDAYFHTLVKDGNTPVADDGNATIEVCVFDSSADYRTYAGAMYGVDANTGGMYLEGDPAASGNRPRFIAHEMERARPRFEIRNLNHEYTHYLDGRFDLYGGFDANVRTPTVWWIEGFAEYVSYSYRKVTNGRASAEAAKHTYALSTLWDTTYGHDSSRIYAWSYLAVRYMLERHPDDVATVLGHYRTGHWNAARTFLTGTIGTRYDADWQTWLASCAAGACAEMKGDDVR